MIPKTKEKTDWLVWAVWIAAGLCLAMIAFFVILLLHFGTVRAEDEDAETLHPAHRTEYMEKIPPETYPVLNLEKSPYTEWDFDYDGPYITCDVVPSRMGIDVSYWQDEIDWVAVKEAGVDFAIIRLGWRGSTEGGIEEDSFARINYEGAKAAGVEVGGYFYSQAITLKEAKEEAEFVLDMIEDWEMDMPIVFDWEKNGGRNSDVNQRTMTDLTKVFCDTIENEGFDAMVYFNVYTAYYGMYLEELKDYGFWLAMYDSRMDFPYKVDMWQYSDSGTVDGINGNVDLNIAFDYAQ